MFHSVSDVELELFLRTVQDKSGRFQLTFELIKLSKYKYNTCHKNLEDPPLRLKFLYTRYQPTL